VASALSGAAVMECIWSQFGVIARLDRAIQ
jgi:hypothetical protein